MRPYEVVVIFDPAIEDAAIHGVLNRSRESLTANDATVNRVDRWGKRRLAYQIDHKSEGDYVLLDVLAEPSAMDTLDRMLGLADEVIRHKIVRVPDHVASRATRPAAAESPAAPAESQTS